MATFDPSKNEENQRKHGINLLACAEAFDSPMLTREDTRENYGEQRFVSLGLARGKVVVLVWTERDDEPRLISCREADRYEQKAYHRAYPTR